MSRWLAFTKESDDEVQHRAGKQHGNADGLSRRPEPRDDENCTEPPETAGRTTANNEVEREVAVLVRESDREEDVAVPLETGDGSTSEWTDLREWQQADPQLGPIIRYRLESDTQLPWSEMSPESEHTKRLWNQWSQLEVHNGLVYRRYEGNGTGQTYQQLLVQRRCVENVIFKPIRVWQAATSVKRKRFSKSSDGSTGTLGKPM